LSEVAAAVAALAAGELAIVPTDTVYGLAATPLEEGPVRRLYRAKGRAAPQPTALVAADVDVLLELIPELRGAPERALRALLPGPYTLIVPNPAHRFPWLTGGRPETIGVRVPAVAGVARELLDGARALVATSANRPGGPDPHTVSEVPEELRAAAAAVVDAGPLPGTPSTVVDLTGPEPVVVREGAVPADAALQAVAAVD
jgi:L-threonylcarbamoyladenylate synthase